MASLNLSKSIHAQRQWQFPPCRGNLVKFQVFIVALAHMGSLLSVWPEPCVYGEYQVQGESVQALMHRARWSLTHPEIGTPFLSLLWLTPFLVEIIVILSPWPNTYCWNFSLFFVQFVTTIANERMNRRSSPHRFRELVLQHPNWFTHFFIYLVIDIVWERLLAKLWLVPKSLWSDLKTESRDLRLGGQFGIGMLSILV